VTRWKLREPYTPERLQEIYRKPHDHRRWPDHLARAEVTIALGAWMLRDVEDPVVADLSTGNACIPHGIVTRQPFAPRPVLGDFAPGYPLRGPIEQTIEQLDDDSVDLFVCSETIEHIADPDALLGRIHAKARRLLLSTPIGESDPSINIEHLWGWDVDEMVGMVELAGFRPVVVNRLEFAYYVYDFMIIAAERY